MEIQFTEKRKYLPTFAELVDRLSICILKSIFIPEHKNDYEKEIEDIMHDIDLIILQNQITINSKAIKAIQTIMLANRYIWENESLVRNGQNQDYALLAITHSINGVRNTAKNVLSHEMGERKDLKIDCLASELKSSMMNWDIFKQQSNMKPHQERVIEEEALLCDKLKKLANFFSTDEFATLDEQERLRLEKQLEAMTIYDNILCERIKAFSA